LRSPRQPRDMGEKEWLLLVLVGLALLMFVTGFVLVVT
jgi:hypothetical protein